MRNMPLARTTPIGRKPRARGNRFEKEVLDYLKARGHHVYRTLGSGGYGGSDIQGLAGYGIECKCVERLNIWAALTQAEAAVSPTDVPLVVFKRNRSETYAALPFAELVALIEASQR